jgi:general secretion pathway protein L
MMTLKEMTALWIDELAGLAANAVERIRPVTAYKLVETPRGFTIVEKSAGSDLPVATLSADGVYAAAIPETTRRMIAQSGLTVELAPGRAVVVPMTLPKTSGPYLHAIIRHQIDRLTPWTRTDALIAAEVQPGNGEHLDLRVTASSRAMLDRLLEILGLADCPVNAVQVRDDNGGTVTLSAGDMAHSDNGRFAQARRAVAFGLAGAGALAVAIIAYAEVTRFLIGRETAEVEVTLAQRQQEIRRYAVPAAQSVGWTWLKNEKASRAPALLVIEDLTQALPTTAYVTGLELKSSRLRIAGVAQEAAALIPRLEGTNRFSRAQFYAPTTSGKDKRGDRFFIEADSMRHGATP